MTSKCVDGEIATIDVIYVGPAVGFGTPITGTKGKIAFEDHQKTIEPDSFNGFAGVVGGGIKIGPKGGTLGKIRLGDAFQRETTEEVGIEFGASIGFGSSTVTNIRQRKCDCN